MTKRIEDLFYETNRYYFCLGHDIEKSNRINEFMKQYIGEYKMLEYSDYAVVVSKDFEYKIKLTVIDADNCSNYLIATEMVKN